MKLQIEIFDAAFSAVNSRSTELLRLTTDDKLFWQPADLPPTYQMFSCGEFVLRSAGAVEQTFGGITTRLWDDPFEWTLPEELSTAERVAEYLAEVETTRRKGFALFQTDDDLQKQMPAPEKLKTIFEILLQCLICAEHFQGRAFAVFQMFSSHKLPRR